MNIESVGRTRLHIVGKCRPAHGERERART
jgi:hypothetical protein